MTKIPVVGFSIGCVISGPMGHRRLDDEHNFIIVGKSAKDANRTVEFHLTDREAINLVSDLQDHLENPIPHTRITTYDDGE